MDIFIDESIHDRGNFIVIAAVFSADNLQELVGMLCLSVDLTLHATNLRAA
jgi:hypothetical protein